MQQLNLPIKLTNHVEHLSTSSVKTKRVIPMLDAKQVREQLMGHRVDVYFNLHKHVFSLRCVKTKLVLAHCNDWFVMHDVKFKVSEAGRQRVIAEKRKNVHAFVQGTIGDLRVTQTSSYDVTYNPYKYASFVASHTAAYNILAPSPIHAAPAVLMMLDVNNKPRTVAYDDAR
jgi:hypothetical protein